MDTVTTPKPDVVEIHRYSNRRLYCVMLGCMASYSIIQGLIHDGCECVVFDNVQGERKDITVEIFLAVLLKAARENRLNLSQLEKDVLRDMIASASV